VLSKQISYGGAFMARPASDEEINENAKNPRFAPQQGCQMCLFSNQKAQFGYIWEGLRLENVDIPIIWQFGIFYGHLGYLTDIWDIL
jgi:hypothetical protein